MYLIFLILTNFASFIFGGAWVQAKEVKYGKKANYNCGGCQAWGCQGMYCFQKRKRG